ncbi:MAG: hypothetical protein ABW321_34360 [Polyangiales bacterium]
MTWFTLDQLAYRVLPQVPPGRALADSEWRTLRAAAEVLLDELPFELAAERVADNVEQFLCDGRSKRAWRCRVLLTVLEVLPLAAYARSFSRLTQTERRHLFETRIIGAHGLWGLCAKVRYLILMGAYGDAKVPAELGVWVPGKARPRRHDRRHTSLPLVRPTSVMTRHNGELSTDSTL